MCIRDSDLAVAQVAQQLLDARFLRGGVVVEGAVRQHKRHVVRAVVLAAALPAIAPVGAGVAHAYEAVLPRAERGVRVLKAGQVFGIAADGVDTFPQLRLRVEGLLAYERRHQKRAQRVSRGFGRIGALGGGDERPLIALGSLSDKRQSGYQHGEARKQDALQENKLVFLRQRMLDEPQKRRGNGKGS